MHDCMASPCKQHQCTVHYTAIYILNTLLAGKGITQWITTCTCVHMSHALDGNIENEIIQANQM